MTRQIRCHARSGWWYAILLACVTLGCERAASSPQVRRPGPAENLEGPTLANPTRPPDETQPLDSASQAISSASSTSVGTRQPHRSTARGSELPSIFREQRLEQAVYRNGQEAGRSSILESLGGGVGILDFDRDGALDLCFTGGGQFAQPERLIGLPTRLLRNMSGISPESLATLTRVPGTIPPAPRAESDRPPAKPLTSERAAETAAPIAPVGSEIQNPEPTAPVLTTSWWEVGTQAGLVTAAHYSHGVLAADQDEDGFCDLLLTGYGGLQLWRNQGDGTFRDETATAQLDDSLWSSSGAWSDFNGDGFLDLYIAHYVNWSFTNDPWCPAPTAGEREVCGPKDFAALPDRLYLSLGDGRFRDASQEAGLRTDGKGLGVVAADFDQDGDVDLYVANDTTDNFLYWNDGHGRFVEAGLAAGVAVDGNGVANGSMGVEVLDYNNDGRPDVCVANYERETSALYRNEGHGQFLYVSKPTGLAALGSQFVSFGVASGDWDSDGDEDLVIVNGHVIKYPHAAPRRQQPFLLENQTARRFERRLPNNSDFFQTPREGRGLARGDLDQDGDLDLVATHLNEAATILWNQLPQQGSFTLELIGTHSPRQPVGAWCRLHTSQGSTLRNFTGGGSYLSTHAPQLTWNFPQETDLLNVEIHWPSGIVQTLPLPHAGRYLRVHEPSSTP